MGWTYKADTSVTRPAEPRSTIGRCTSDGNGADTVVCAGARPGGIPLCRGHTPALRPLRAASMPEWAVSAASLPSRIRLPAPRD
eukprot:4825265-Prymnesium_polylepis.1